MAHGYVVELLKKLIEVPTVNPPGKCYREMAELLKSEMESMGLSVELIEVPEEYLDEHYPYAPQHKRHPRLIVLGRTGRGQPALHFNGHYDVVPPGSGWSFNPFKPVVRGGKVYGRGATDMKGGIAAVLAGLREALREGEPPGTIELAFVPDEESGGVGTRYLVEEAGLKPRWVVIAEPSTSRLVGVGHKGMVRGVVRVLGKQGHASRPWRAVNAFEAACRIALQVAEEFGRESSKLRSEYPFEEEEARYTSLSLGGYAASSAMKDNVVPGEFVFSFDIRTIPEDSNERAFTLLKAAAEHAASTLGVKVVVEKLADIPAAWTPLDSPLLSFVVEVAERVAGIKPRPVISPGRYDLVYYRRAGAHVVAYGPGVEGQAHAVDEYVTLEELQTFVAVYKAMVLEANRLKSSA